MNLLVLVAGAVFLFLWQPNSFTLLALVFALGMTVHWIRTPTGGAPVRFDRHGVTFVDAGDGPEVIPWASVASVVIFETAEFGPAPTRWTPAVGVRLRGSGEQVSVHRPLNGWVFDRPVLEQAVLRLGGVTVVDRPRSSPPSSAGIPAAVAGHREVPGGTGDVTSVPRTWALEWQRTARYQPRATGAYVARMDLRSNLVPIIVIVAAGTFFTILVAIESPGWAAVVAVVFIGVPSLLFWRQLRGGGAVTLAVDAPGVFLGESWSAGDDQTHRLVPWTEVGAIVLYDQLVIGSKHRTWEPAVGIRPPGDWFQVTAWRIVQGWRLDRAALEAAVARFAPETPVIEGPPQHSPTA